MKLYFLVLSAICALVNVKAADPAMECAACTVMVGMTEEVEVQVKFMEKMKADKCGSMGTWEKKACELALDKAASAVLGKAVPEQMCAKVGMCKEPFSQCKLYSEWPIKHLPDQPQSWPVERRSLLEEAERNLGGIPSYEAELEKFMDKVKAVIKAHQDSTSTATPSASSDSKFFDFMQRLTAMQYALRQLLDGASSETLFSAKDDNGCSLFDFKCKGQAVGKHLPFADSDGDSFSTKQELRGYDWRGQDCDDKNADVHPGRASVPNGVAADSDFNCNGISGKNATGSYEDLFCSGANAPRPLIALGDSATAHFHLPPQWFTAKGWNLDGIKRVAEDEMDVPACSWSTGHADAQNCPYQDEVPGLAQGQITSLYTQLRARNRCNNNAFTNIGVNGARMTSAMGLVDAVKIDREHDAPVTLWLSLIGNDVCKSDTNYTPIDEFYNDAVGQSPPCASFPLPAASPA